jgi:formate hydrogenlyase transcriptional activator
VILCAGDTLSIDEAWLSGRAPESEVLPEALRDQERVRIEVALAQCRGKVAGADGAAARLGVPASTLESKIRQLKIEKGRYSRSSR